MKNIFKIFSLGLAVLGGTVWAAPLVAEAPIKEYGTPTTISVSTSAWTKLPTSSTLDGRFGLLVSNPASSNAVMVAHLGNCTSTAIATTVRPLEIAKGGFILVPVSPSVCVWALSLHTSAENIHVQEIKQ